jgi:hypothetical protein
MDNVMTPKENQVYRDEKGRLVIRCECGGLIKLVGSGAHYRSKAHRAHWDRVLNMPAKEVK